MAGSKSAVTASSSWDPHYTALTEIHDPDQDPQNGGLALRPLRQRHLHLLAYAFFRQMPEGVPGSFRIMANLLSASKNQQLKSTPTN